MASPENKFFRARLVKREEFAPDLWMVRIDPGGDFKFVPGQYATLGIEKDGKRIERPYSIVSSPAEPAIEFFFELLPEGALTPLLYRLQSGDELLMRKAPKGRFLLETHTGRSNHLLVSTVTGVAPFVSYVRTLHKEWKEGNFDGSHKLYLLKFGYLHELLRFAQEIPWFTYVPTLSRPWDHGDWTGEMGRADDVLRKYADQWGLQCRQYHRVSLRPSENDRAQQGHPEAAGIFRQGSDQGRDLLGSGEIVPRTNSAAASRRFMYNSSAAAARAVNWENALE
jgi:ferredoxin--NADP+ reductase